MKGIKYDNEKVQPLLILKDMARAIKAVSEVSTFGAKKYTEGGWLKVPNAVNRYENAGHRHMLDRYCGIECDEESRLLHLAHEAWNKLAVLELYLRELEESNEG